jgi:hypothetical protein
VVLTITRLVIPIHTILCDTNIVKSKFSIVLLLLLVIPIFYVSYLFVSGKPSPDFSPLQKTPTAGFIDGESNTITQLPKPGNATSVIMDFSNCSRGSDSVSFAFGSMHFAFEGIKENNCVFYYGGEVEDPNWDRSLPYKCNVPVALGKKTYTVSTMGVLMEELNNYCTKL